MKILYDIEKYSDRLLEASRFSWQRLNEIFVSVDQNYNTQITVFFYLNLNFV